MKKWLLFIILPFLFMVLTLRYLMWDKSIYHKSFESRISNNSSDPGLWLIVPNPPEVHNQQNQTQVFSADLLASNISAPAKLLDGKTHLHTWNHLRQLVNYSHGLPHGVDAIREAVEGWGSLMASVEEENLKSQNHSNNQKSKEKLCPYSIRRMNASETVDGKYQLKIPCGLVQGSSITIIGTPDGLQGNFRIELTGTALPGEEEPPVMLHYNVRLVGDKLTEDPVIVQNTWTATGDWGSEERCPSDSDDSTKVDDFERCSIMSNKEESEFTAEKTPNQNASSSKHIKSVIKKKFPFQHGYLAIAILRVGAEGIHMTVDGKHITSFSFRENLEPLFATEVRISGDIQLTSVIASGLPTSEDLMHGVDLHTLKAPPLALHTVVDLLIGIFSTANNFKRRMAVRRTWMQYSAVRSGNVAVRFFVGLHNNHLVNEELLNEATTYGDIQLMPFVDYYSLISWKTIAICIYGTRVLSAKYVMKTDDDSFVRVDEILSSLKQANIRHGLLYGRINHESKPHRNPDSKWHITSEEWPEDNYPPWAHGPGYVVSQDIAKQVSEDFMEGQLKMFKLEDVAMGVWIDKMRRNGRTVKYINDERIFVEGCTEGYVVAHYQQPRSMLCMWERLLETKRGVCCKDT